MYQTTRAEVMEKGVAIEAGISGILGYILNIEAKSSKSFGYHGSALSFNAKVNLLTDLKFVPKEIARQFQIVAEVRNKFAHVQYVDNFTKCFEIVKDHKQYLLDTFTKAAPKGISEEDSLNLGFTFLCYNLGMWMNLILERSKYLKIQEVKKTAVVEMLRHFLSTSAPEKDTEEDKKFMEQVDIVINDIEQDKDFMTSVVEAVKAGEK
ncbi:MAG TPA: hypothetical protein VF411_09330 [Bacteroidia bacterium]